MTWLGVFFAPTAWAENDNTTRLSVTIDGQPLDGDVVLDSSAATRLVVGVENLGGSALEVDAVRLSGTVFGITFFGYDTRVRTTVPARGAATWTVDLDLRGLTRRVSGSLPVRVEIRDTDLTMVAAENGRADVHGSLFSAYGLFGLGLFALAGLLLAMGLLPGRRHGRPAAPWRRGLRLVPAGCVAGLFAVLALSAMGLTAPSTPTDLAITLSTTLIAFGIGCALPERAPVTPADNNAGR
ncbi:hypothetical protein MXD62_28400 [Frankia sp. Mgl5]|uniref:hypothetical protein n=1 Tax=Frankia sp. Mgl5 TaxID=2933793 RepID=UPI00201084F3|nr:hypothetical protein [Frankia sp. Mgl5]MCK9931017.1 hypothetical protein [Frankia sp. Mgl5]